MRRNGGNTQYETMMRRQHNATATATHTIQNCLMVQKWRAGGTMRRATWYDMLGPPSYSWSLCARARQTCPGYQTIAPMCCLPKHDRTPRRIVLYALWSLRGARSIEHDSAGTSSWQSRVQCKRLPQETMRLAWQVKHMTNTCSAGRKHAPKCTWQRLLQKD